MTPDRIVRLRKRLARRLIDAWETIRDRPSGRAVRAVRDAADPLVHASWVAATWLRTRDPTTLNDKVKYKMLHDRRPILTTLTDKVDVRDVVRDRIGVDHLTHLFQVHDDAAAVRWDELPREFACKVTHASGGTIIVTDSADPDRPLPTRLVPGHGRLVVHPDAFDPDRATGIVRAWLSRRYGWSGWKREWAYLGVRPRVLVEEFLGGSASAIPSDYKLFVFDGTCRFVQLDLDRHGDHRRDVYTPDWERLPVDYNYPRADVPSARPERLDEMIAIAERLGEGHDFVRVDLYALPSRVVFGETTFYPASGNATFDPPEYDRILGSWWTVPARYL